LRPRHFAKAAKEENDNERQINQASVRKADAVDDQRADEAEPNHRFGEEWLHDPPQTEAA
jgi:hypothetical protein